MPLNLNSNKFKSYKEKASNRALKSSGFSDERFINFEAGNKYKFRLLWWDDERPESDPDRRDAPFVETYIHTAKDDLGKRHTITCPTTFDSTSAGFKACKCCETSSTLYKSGQEGCTKDAELYSLYKRKFHGYALIHVVSDPTTPENNGKVKLMHYSIKAKRFLDSEIFGIESTWGKDDNDEDNLDGDEVGEGAFQLENGFDLIVTVKKNGQWNDYNFKFARTATTVSADLDTLEEEIKALRFDEIRKRSNPNEIENFYTDVILGNDSQAAMIDTVEADSSPADDNSFATSASEVNELFNGGTEEVNVASLVETDDSEPEVSVADDDSEEEFDVQKFIDSQND
jgi:hypothetical protein